MNTSAGVGITKGGDERSFKSFWQGFSGQRPNGVLVKLPACFNGEERRRMRIEVVNAESSHVIVMARLVRYSALIYESPLVDRHVNGEGQEVKTAHVLEV